MTTFTQTVTTFTSKRGNKVVVKKEKGVSHNGVFSGFNDTVRCFAEVCGVQVEVETGAAFKAASAVEAAGF